MKLKYVILTMAILLSNTIEAQNVYEISRGSIVELNEWKLYVCNKTSNVNEGYINYKTGDKLPTINSNYEYIVLKTKVRIIERANIAIMTSNGDWPIEVYVNGIMVDKKGIYENTYRSTIYYASMALIDNTLKLGDVIEIELRAFPKKEKTAIPLMYIGEYSKIAGKEYMHNLLNVNLVQASVVLSIIIAIYYIFVYIKMPTKDKKYLYLTIMCIMYSVGYSNMALWNEAISDTVLDKISRIGLTITVIAMLEYSIRQVGSKRNRILMSIIWIIAVIVSMLIIIAKDKYQIHTTFNYLVAPLIVIPTLIIIGKILIVNYYTSKSGNAIVVIGYIAVIIAVAHDLYHVIAGKTPVAFVMPYGYIILMVAIFITIGLEQGDVFDKSKKAELLEKIVEKRKELQNKVMDNINLGLVVIGKDHIIKNEVSRQANEILGKKIEGRDISEILYDSENEKKDLKDGLKLIFSGKVIPEMIIEHQNKEIVIKDRICSLKYKMINNEEMLITIRDNTENIIQKKKNEIDIRNREIVHTVVNNKLGYKEYKLKIEKIVNWIINLDKIKNTEIITRELKTAVNTSWYFGFSAMATILNETRYKIEDREVLGGEIDTTEVAKNIRITRDKEFKVIDEIADTEWEHTDNYITLDRQRYIKYAKYIGNSGRYNKAIQSAIRELDKISLRHIMNRTEQVAKITSRQMGKDIMVGINMGTVIKVRRSYVKVISEIMNKIVKYSIEHGIEDKNTRIDMGKNSKGTITIDIAETGGTIQITVVDDGKGTNKYIDRNQEEMIELDKVTIMGNDHMDEIKKIYDLVSSRNGSMRLQTIKGKYTKIVVNIPKNM